MANKSETADIERVAMWTKRCFLAGRVAMEAALRPYGIGTTQWYVLHHLVTNGPTKQRVLPKILDIERATLSVIVAALVRKGLVEQVVDSLDQRQKSLSITAAGEALWQELPDLTSIQHAAFAGMEPADLSAAINVLRTAAERLDELSRKGARS
jgi:DNA-binding MarR family transcriptional regulator